MGTTLWREFFFLIESDKFWWECGETETPGHLVLEQLLLEKYGSASKNYTLNCRMIQQLHF
jgi:hypothetical protein